MNVRTAHELVHWHFVWTGLIVILCAICHLLRLLVILATASGVLGHIDHTMLSDLIHELLLLLAHHATRVRGRISSRLISAGAAKTPLVTLLLGQAIRTEFKHCTALGRA